MPDPFKISISYGISVCTEAVELEKLLSCLLPHIHANDEIIVLSDEEKVTREVLQVIDRYKDRIKPVSFPLNHDFAAFKNNFIHYASKDYLFQLDADEIPNTYLLQSVKDLLYRYKDFDCIKVPRVNYVMGITREHLKKWDWEMDNHSRINFPDLQMRIFKLNKGIVWINKVHEMLTNYKNVGILPYHENEDYCLYHWKTIEKQEEQNNYYDTIQK